MASAATDNRKYSVYMHTSPSGKVYIGITGQDLKQRWRNGRGYIHNQHMSNAIEKYGWDNFSHEVIYSGLNEDEAKRIEIELIEQYNATDRRFGYNVREGGSCSPCSEETKKKMSEAKKGKRYSDEARKKMSLAKKGKAPWNKGKHFSDESRRKMSIAQKTKAFRRVLVMDSDGNPVGVYRTVKFAAESLGLSKDAISACIHCRAKTHHGYTFSEWCSMYEPQF